MMVKGKFLATPEPEVMLTDASREYLNQKHTFEAQRLQKWFS
jgi:hypothetical protein